MSAQKLSASFPLRKFRSVGYLIFKCLAWHICLNPSLIRTGIMKNKSVVFFIFFSIHPSKKFLGQKLTDVSAVLFFKN